jgi:8-oxo-dGTP diphosphatase
MPLSLETAKFVVGIIGVIRRGDSYLILKRSETKSTNPGAWEPVAGKMEFGESPGETLVREVFEEAGLHIEAPSAPVYTAQSMRGSEPMLLLYYVCECPEGEVYLSKEHSEYAWVEASLFKERVVFSEIQKLFEIIAIKNSEYFPMPRSTPQDLLFKTNAINTKYFEA